VFLAAQWGIADFNALTTRHELKEWTRKGEFPNIAWEATRSRVQLSVYLDSGNPDHYEDMARLHLLKSSMPKLPPEGRKLALGNSLLAFRKASWLKPSSAHYWAMLMAVKSDLREYDQEYLHAFDNAVFLGPWEQIVALVVAETGPNAWDVLSEQQKGQVLRYLSSRRGKNPVSTR